MKHALVPVKTLLPAQLPPAQLPPAWRCAVCGGEEGTLCTECPGERLSREEMDCVWFGFLDYRDGIWVYVRGAEEATV
jgi:hypothetical protein